MIKSLRRVMNLWIVSTVLARELTAENVQVTDSAGESCIVAEWVETFPVLSLSEHATEVRAKPTGGTTATV